MVGVAEEQSVAGRIVSIEIVREGPAMNDRDITWFRLQLTLMRWYLDAASSAATEAAHHYLQRVRNVYETSEHALNKCQLTHDERREVEMELSVLWTELEPGGSP